MNVRHLPSTGPRPRQYDPRRWGYACVILLIAIVIGWWGWNSENNNATHLRQFVYGLCNEVAAGNLDSPGLMTAETPLRQELRTALSGMVQNWGDMKDELEVNIALSDSELGYSGSHSATIFISGEPRMMLTLELGDVNGLPTIVGYEEISSGR